MLLLHGVLRKLLHLCQAYLATTIRAECLRSRAVDKNYYLTMGDTRETLGQGKRDIGGHWGTLGDIGRHWETKEKLGDIKETMGDSGRQKEDTRETMGDNGRHLEA
jgi:hypothetical protein